MKLKQKHPDVILAAGGLVWRKNNHSLEILIVHRPKYNDWSLPKGKLKEDEGFVKAAIREIKEETGGNPTLLSFAGTVSYTINNTPKVILYWHMKLDGKRKFKPNLEVDQVTWAPINQIDQILTYPLEIDLVKSSSTSITTILEG